MQQQGDVNIWPTELPSLAQKRTDRVVRRGETTGHSHRLTGDVELYELGDRIFARVLAGNAAIVHEEHKTQPLPPLPDGQVYEFGPTHEYDHFAEKAREVAD